MQNIQGAQAKARYVIPAAVAILLIFGRGGMLPFMRNSFNLLDQAMNIFVVVIAPFFAVKEILQRPREHNFLLLLPTIFFWAWMAIVIVVFSPSQYWPVRTQMITIALAIFLCSQIHYYELRRVRLFILVIGVIYCISLLVFAQDTLKMILSGRLEVRLGATVSHSIVVLYPRMLYMLVLTCFITVLLEKQKILKLIAAAIIPFPMLIALSTGGRGAMVGLSAGVIVFVLGFGKVTGKVVGLVITGLVGLVGYQIVIKYLPLMQERLQTKDMTRANTWQQLLNMDKLSLFGTGIKSTYPHNIFVECLVTYGLIGFSLFLLLLFLSVSTAWKTYRTSRNNEVLWVISMLVLQMTAQQFSLDVFTPGALWAVMVLPLGLGLLKQTSPQNRQVANHYQA